MRGKTLIFRDDKASADGKEDLLRQQNSIAVECGKAHTVGVRRKISNGIHLITMKDQVLRLVEGDGVMTWQFQPSRGTNRR